MFPRLIAFTGLIGVGKTTACDEIKKQFDSTSQINFSDALKRHALEIGWNGKKDKRGRKLLQILGTEVCRECISEDYWVDRWQASFAVSSAVHIFCDDLRFDNEAQCILENKGVIIKITRPGIVGQLHKSEHGISSEYITFKVFNEGTPCDLKNEILKGLSEC